MSPGAAAPRGAGAAVGGQHQHREGGGTAASLVLLPAHGDHYNIDTVLLTLPFELHISSRTALLCFSVLPLQTKSMSHHLFLTSKLDVPRRQRFPDRFVDDIAALVCAISADIASRYHKVNSLQSNTSEQAKHLHFQGFFFCKHFVHIFFLFFEKPLLILTVHLARCL